MKRRSERRLRYARASGLISAVSPSATAARQDEALQRLEPLVHQVAELLEPLDLLGGDPQALALVLERHGEVRAQVEELVLNPLEPRPKLRRQLWRRERERQERVELVDRAVGLDSQVGLGHTAAVAEARLPRVPRARVDPRQADGLIPLPHEMSSSSIPAASIEAAARALRQRTRGNSTFWS